ncbi:MAG TPA: murein biosynthesis integral membrane protein MurJ [Anaerolineae bacterium]|nr:murein biosynthesis integral membrane protein MurJ [Anaerolineae bacterium]
MDDIVAEDVVEASDSEGGGRVVRAAAVLALGNVASRILGLVRETVKANLFGASGLLSAFEVAAYVPTSLFELVIGGMVNSALVPVFSEYTTEERRAELWPLLSTFLSVAAAVLLSVVVLVELFAPQVAWLVGARNFDDPSLTATSIRLMRLATPAIFFMGLSSILSGVLYALQRFTLPAFTAAVFNGTMAGVALLWPEKIDSLVWGLLLGSLLQVVIQLPALRDFKWEWRRWHPALGRIWQLYVPIVAGLVINQLAIGASINLATRTGDESLTFMRFATTLYQFPLGLVVTALSIATLPMLSQQALGDMGRFKETLAGGIRLVMALILPATVGLFTLALPIVALLFEHGQFTPEDSVMTALVLRVYLFGLPFAAIDQMLVFGSYARQDTWHPALIGVISIVIYLGVAVLLIRPLGLLSLMVADAVKHVVHTGMMLWVLRRDIGSLWGYGVGVGAMKAGGASVVMGGLAYGAFVVMGNWVGDGLWGEVMVVAVPGAVGGVVYAGLVYGLGIEEVLRLVKRS